MKTPKKDTTRNESDYVQDLTSVMPLMEEYYLYLMEEKGYTHKDALARTFEEEARLAEEERIEDAYDRYAEEMEDNHNG